MRRGPFHSQITGLEVFIGLAVFAEVFALSLMPGYNPAVVWPIIIAAAALGTVALITLVVLVFLGRSYMPKIAAILGGAYWAHWRYDMGEWERFKEQKRRRNRKMLGRAGAALAVAIGVVVVLSGTSNLGLNNVNLLYLLVLGAVLLIALAYTFGRWSLFSWRHDSSVEAYIAPLGVYRPDGYIPLRDFNRKLLGVAIVPGDPAALVFTCRVTTFAGTALVRIPLQIGVPIPAGHEDEARALATRFAPLLSAH